MGLTNELYSVPFIHTRTHTNRKREKVERPDVYRDLQYLQENADKFVNNNLSMPKDARARVNKRDREKKEERN